ncbi:uncharacterized protein BT62DRAFT_928708 [Guyanagaster necrorhizus]|uniref:Uncharacterized protein n=1 Tax=Guyanagaster necrorhizus TaxID=856835 RepID=A0A9P7W0X4_9AGAR|nr:uncharacterized protein BT62DRAFT_928708 [Guyanagaster necrorhizus MCA 3950]KAG7449939.1 hypothetical protein BT62DRAFT_928708 [Guyanagaster necrorhizus MCA 3950]
MVAFPANIRDFLTFLPLPPLLGPDPYIGATTAAYTTHDILTSPSDRPLLSRLDDTLLPRLAEYLTSTVADSDIDDVSCESMRQTLHTMRFLELEDENSVSLYGQYATREREPVVDAISNAVHLESAFTLVLQPVRKLLFSQKGDFTITPVRENEKAPLPWPSRLVPTECCPLSPFYTV